MDIQSIHIFITVILLLYVLFYEKSCKCNCDATEHMTGSIDSINSEALQNMASIYNGGTLTVDNIKVTNNVDIEGSINSTGPIKSKTYVLAGDGAKEHTFITPEGIDSKNNNSGKTLQINHRGNGNIEIYGHVRVNNNLKSNNIESTDYIKAKRLDINGPKGTTHLNHENSGINYFRGGNNIFKEDLRLEKYNSLIVNGGCNKPSEWRLHWGCNANHAFG